MILEHVDTPTAGVTGYPEPGRFKAVLVDHGCDFITGIFSRKPGFAVEILEGLPRDAGFVGVYRIHSSRDMWAFLFEHESFAVVGASAAIPLMQPVYRQHLVEDLRPLTINRVCASLDRLPAQDGTRFSPQALEQLARTAHAANTPVPLPTADRSVSLVQRAALAARYPRESWMGDDEYDRFLRAMGEKEW